MGSTNVRLSSEKFKTYRTEDGSARFLKDHNFPDDSKIELLELMSDKMGTLKVDGPLIRISHPDIAGEES